MILRYDDIWLGQLTAISERASLLKFQENIALIIKSILKSDSIARKLYDEFIVSEGSEDLLIKLVNYLLEKYSESFKPNYIPHGKQKDEYIADIIQILASAEA